ncbi:MAG TPA: AAA family ATPase, partial [Bacteroidales bacterium]|nr:AAA family ATPase [Bacteroidales bacterium]
MNIRIAKISAENCGPVKKINIAPGNLTIFYGRNEDGKSFLVEFIIHCLFKNKKPWGDLRQAGGGKITLTGIKDKPVDFIPDKGVKLEDYFERDSRGLPLSLLNLLVVKEGETGIGNNKEELTKDIVKTFLSSRRLLDEIDGKIPATFKEAKIDTDIEIDKRGGRDYYNKLEEIKKIDNIIYSLNNQSAHWLIRDLSLQENQLKCKKELLNRARKFKAYTLSTKIKAVEKQLEKIP